jgi:preprotein translocase subunit SecE
MAEENKQAKKGFTKGLKSEFDKIIWTDRKTLGKQTVAVLVISIIICILITLVDGASLGVIQQIIK